MSRICSPTNLMVVKPMPGVGYFHFFKASTRKVRH